MKQRSPYLGAIVCSVVVPLTVIALVPEEEVGDVSSLKEDINRTVNQ